MKKRNRGLMQKDGGKIFSMRVTEAQRAKIERLGGAKWIRARIDRARERVAEK